MGGEPGVGSVPADVVGLGPLLAQEESEVSRGVRKG